MKKILFLILMVMMLTVGIVGTVSADYIRGSSGDKLETYVAQGTDEAVALATIPSGTRILGFIVVGDGAAGLVGLYDVAGLTTAAVSNCIAEGGCASDTTESIFFPMPYTIETRLVLVFDASTTSITVYYE